VVAINEIRLCASLDALVAQHLRMAQALLAVLRKIDLHAVSVEYHTRIAFEQWRDLPRTFDVAGMMSQVQV